MRSRVDHVGRARRYSGTGFDSGLDGAWFETTILMDSNRKRRGTLFKRDTICPGWAKTYSARRPVFAPRNSAGRDGSKSVFVSDKLEMN